MLLISLPMPIHSFNHLTSDTHTFNKAKEATTNDNQQENCTQEGCERQIYTPTKP